MEEKCVALTDYSSTRHDELSFKKGDVITVVAKGTDSGFWEGVDTKNNRGMFPNCLVSSNMQPNRPPVFTNKCVALYAYEPKNPQELKFAKHDIITAVRDAPSPGWWFGVNETKRRQELETVGYVFPKNLRRGEKPPPEPPVPADEEGLFPSNFVSCNVVRAMFPFQGRQKCELTIEPGDVIILHRRWNDGWWEGSLPNAPKPQEEHPEASPALRAAKPAGGGVLVAGLRRGIFPSNYTAPNVCTLTPPLFCSKCRSVYPPLSRECKDCHKNEEIVRSMTQALNDYGNGTLESDNYPKRPDGAVGSEGSAFRAMSPTDDKPKTGKKVDIFAYVDLDPSKGKGSLLGAGDMADTSVRPRLAA